MQSIRELKRTILESSGTDWERFDDPLTWVYKPDPRLRIEQYGDHSNEMDYRGAWLERYHHSEDTKIRFFRVYFNQSPIDHLHVLWVDEGRCNMPSPQVEPHDDSDIEKREEYDEVSLNRYQEGIARAMTGEWKHYKNLGDIEIRDEDGI